MFSTEDLESLLCKYRSIEPFLKDESTKSIHTFFCILLPALHTHAWYRLQQKRHSAIENTIMCTFSSILCGGRKSLQGSSSNRIKEEGHSTAGPNLQECEKKVLISTYH